MLAEEQEFLGEACSRSEQGIDLAVGLEVVEPSDGGQDGLLRAAVAPVVFDDLEIGAGAGLFGAEDQGGLLIEPP
jgi:hypothetical protein